MSIEHAAVSTALAALYNTYRKPAFDMTRSLAPPLKPYEIDTDPGIETVFLGSQDAEQFFEHDIDYISDDQNHNRSIVVRAFQKLHELGFFVIYHTARRFQVGTFHAFTFAHAKGEVRVKLNYFEPAINPLPWGDLKRRLAMNFDIARKTAGKGLTITYADVMDSEEEYGFEVKHDGVSLLRVVHEGYSPGLGYAGNQAPSLNTNDRELRDMLGYNYPLFNQVHGALLFNGFILARAEESWTASYRRVEFMFQRGRAVTYIEFRKGV